MAAVASLPHPAPAHEIRLVAERLHADFDASTGPATVEHVVADEVARFGTARVETFVPLLVERAARRRLRTAA